MDDFTIRLLSEAVRAHDLTPAGRTDLHADAAAREAGGDPERRILSRTRALQDFSQYADAFERVKLLFAIGLSLIAGLAGLAGAATVQAAMAPDEHGQLNFFTLLFAILGIQVLALLVWVVLFVVSGGTTGLLGSIAREFLEKFVLWAGRSGVQIAVLSATIGILFRSAIGRWTIGTITHGVWLVFLMAALALTAFQLSTKSYSFVWETTILSSSFFVPLTQAISFVPSMLGFAVPDNAAIMASEAVGASPRAAAHRDEWAALLFGSIAVYGVLPRLVLMMYCLVMGWRARRRYRLDTTTPGFAELLPRLMPHASKGGYVDPDTGTVPLEVPGRAAAYVNRTSANPDGPAAVLGFEIESPATGWPPDLGEYGLIDLGRVESGHELRNVIDRLRDPEHTPRHLILVGSLLTTPDRGLRSLFEHVFGAIDVPATLILTDGGALRERSGSHDVQLRVSDWRAMVAEYFSEPGGIVEIDLNHLTDVTRTRLTFLVGGKGVEQSLPSGSRLRSGFDMILQDFANWQDEQQEPAFDRQAELHRRIARLYSGESGDTGSFLSFGGNRLDLDAAGLVKRLQTGAGIMTGILPGRLVADSKWLFAGGLAGAIGCIAAATLASPVAIAALPIWAGAGAALGAVLSGKDGDGSSASQSPPKDTDVLRAAVLFSLVLDAQGYDEVTITRLIDDAIGDDDADINSLADAQAWLDRVHTRYQTAQKREAAR